MERITFKHTRPQDVIRVWISSLPPQHPVWKPDYHRSAGSRVCEEGHGVSWCTTVSSAPWKKRDTDIAINSNVIKVKCNFLLCLRMNVWRWKESDGIHSLLHQTPLIKSTTLCGKEAALTWKSSILQKMWSSLNDRRMWADGWGRARRLYALNRHLLGPHDFDWPGLSGSTHACISLKCSPCCEQNFA